MAEDIKITAFYYHLAVQENANIRDFFHDAATIDTILFDTFKDISDNKNPQIMSLQGTSFIFQLYDVDPKGVFGTLGRASNADDLTQIRHRTTLAIENIPQSKAIEDYTYFYIDFKTLHMLAIHKRALSRLHDIFTTFIGNSFNNAIVVNPIKAEDWKERITKLKNINLNVRFKNSADAKNRVKKIRTLEDIVDHTEHIVFSFRLKNKQPSQADTACISNIYDKKEEFSKLSIVGSNEWNHYETINLINLNITKQAILTFDTLENTENNRNHIKRELIKMVNVL